MSCRSIHTFSARLGHSCSHPQDPGENLFADLADGDYSAGTVQADGRALVHRDEADDGDYFIEPDDAGLYHLAELGWVFVQTD